MLFNTKPSDSALEEALKYVVRIFADKQEHVQGLTQEKAAAFLGKNPEYLYEVGYEEPVLAAAFGEKFNLRQWFRDIAAADNLKTLTSDGYLAINDLALVREIARRGESALFHKGKAFPYTVEGEGRKAKIVKYARALSKRTGAVNGKAYLSRSTADTSVNTAEVDAVINTLPTVKEHDAVDREHAKALAELAQLKAENLRLKSHTPVSPNPIPPVEIPSAPSTVTVQ